MRLPEELRESRGRRSVVLACCAIALAAALAGAAPAQQPSPEQKANTPPTATTKPATGGDAQAQDAAGLRHLIEEKMRELGQDPTALPERPPMNAPRAAQTRPAKSAAITPQRAFLSKEAFPTSGPASTEPAGSQPAKGCSAGAKTQVDLTPPPPDQPQPRWTLAQDTIEAPPTWKGKDMKFVFHVKNTGEGVLNIQLKGS